MQERKNCLYLALILRSTHTMKLSSELLRKVACESLFAVPEGNDSQYICHCEENYFQARLLIQD